LGVLFTEHHAGGLGAPFYFDLVVEGDGDVFDDGAEFGVYLLGGGGGVVGGEDVYHLAQLLDGVGGGFLTEAHGVGFGEQAAG